MACEIDIFDAAEVDLNPPQDEDILLFLLPTKLLVFRKWGTVKEALVPTTYDEVVEDAPDPDKITTGTGNITLEQFAGFRVNVFRNGILQTRNPTTGGYYYTYDQPTGEFNFVPAAAKDEIFQIQAY